MYRSFDMVILTKSSKYGKYCVAGLDLTTGALVRLVSDDETSHGALASRDLMMQNGQVARPLDVVRVQNAEPCPGAIQTENHRLDAQSKLEYIGRMSIEEVLERCPPSRSSGIFNGFAPVMARQRSADIGHSLEVRRVEYLVVRRLTSDGKPRTKADFMMNGRAFKDYSVTDPRYYGTDGSYELGSACVVFSIAEDEWSVNQGRFKFIAAIYPIKADDTETSAPAGDAGQTPAPAGEAPRAAGKARVAGKRRVIEHAKGYMQQLSEGIDPIGGEAVAADSVVAEPRLKKCFAFIAELLEELLANDGRVDLSDGAAQAKQEAPPPVPVSPEYELVRRKAPFRLSAEQRRYVQITREPVTPTVFVNHINRVVDAAAMEKLSIKRVNAWLMKNGYIAWTKQPAIIQRTVIKPMEKAVALGSQEEEQTDPKTGEIKPRIVLTPQAQAFLLDNLDRILEE